jgi:hypothetical protein
MTKHAVSCRFDTRRTEHEVLAKAVDETLGGCMLESPRRSVWQQLETGYYVTNAEGPARAKALELIEDSSALVYAGPI